MPRVNNILLESCGILCLANDGEFLGRFRDESKDTFKSQSVRHSRATELSASDAGNLNSSPRTLVKLSRKSKKHRVDSEGPRLSEVSIGTYDSASTFNTAGAAAGVPGR